MNKQIQLFQEDKLWAAQSKQVAKLYELKPEEQIRDITASVLESKDLTEIAKNQILHSKRRIFVFWYPSDGLKVKGFISLVPQPINNPLLILLRGGNRAWALLNPGTILASHANYTVISTTYRGGISEGEDEYGGADVNDVKNLIEFIPTLSQLLSLELTPSYTYMLGGSRGAMQMFLTLARYPYLQNRIDKIVSLSGLLDIEIQMAERPDMKQMFIDDFGLKTNEQEWINRRNPILTVPHIKKSLPILILQGTADSRVNLKEGHCMKAALKANGNLVTYVEIEGGEHCLANIPNRMEIIGQWLKD
jgi:dipeptidyl aminopeptidase/acylaminoacyl peptidase